MQFVYWSGKPEARVQISSDHTMSTAPLVIVNVAFLIMIVFLMWSLKQTVGLMKDCDCPRKKMPMFETHRHIEGVVATI